MDTDELRDGLVSRESSWFSNKGTGNTGSTGNSSVSCIAVDVDCKSG